MEDLLLLDAETFETEVRRLEEQVRWEQASDRDSASSSVSLDLQLQILEEQARVISEQMESLNPAKLTLSDNAVRRVQMMFSADASDSDSPLPSRKRKRSAFASGSDVEDSFDSSDAGDMSDEHVSALRRPSTSNLTSAPARTRATKQLFCRCQSAYDPQKPMIQCALCHDWLVFNKTLRSRLMSSVNIFQVPSRVSQPQSAS